ATPDRPVVGEGPTPAAVDPRGVRGSGSGGRTPDGGRRRTGDERCPHAPTVRAPLRTPLCTTCTT
ncbi:hypothetical protein ACFV6B_34480, partial [Streptomyces microflavus]|uniref:hypothetical protein n=1 Tax=Streptomyces microflavus TaxID=1919 RepID=UPI0036556A7B